MTTRGRLRVFLGAAPGVGKTYGMLAEGRRRAALGADCVIAVVETHGRRATEAMAEGLEVVPRRTVRYRGVELAEMDLDAVLAREPQVALVDELAHTNAPGSRHAKRWGDVDELLDAGIEVVTTVNIQHLESVADLVTGLTGVRQQETMPDEFVRAADELELVDISPEALRRRLVAGEIYPPDRVDAALSHYFRPHNLTGLRELALLWLADRVEEARRRAEEPEAAPWAVRERVVVGVSGGPESDAVIRRAARMVEETPGSALAAVAVATLDERPRAPGPALLRNRILVESLGGTWHQVVASDVAEALCRFAAHEHATQLVIGQSRRSGPARWAGRGGAVTRKVLGEAGAVDVHIVVDDRPSGPRGSGTPGIRSARPWLATVAAVALLALTTALLWLVSPPTSAALATLAAVAAGEVAVLGTWAAARASRGRRALATASAQTAVMTAVANSSVAGGGLPRLLEQVRESFGFDAVSVLERHRRERGTGDAWDVLASAGDRPPETPADATTSVPFGGDRLLAARGRLLAPVELETFEAVGELLASAERGRRADRRAATAEHVLADDREHGLVAAATGREVEHLLASTRTTLDELAGLAGPGRSARATELATAAASGLRRVSVLLRELTAFTRARTGSLDVRLRPVEIADVVTAALDDLGPGRHGLAVEVPDDLPDAIADAALLVRIVTVLVSRLLRHPPAPRPPAVGTAAVGMFVELRFDDPGAPTDAGCVPAGTRVDGAADGAPSRADDASLLVATALVETVGGSLATSALPDGGERVTVRLLRAAPGR